MDASSLSRPFEGGGLDSRGPRPGLSQYTIDNTSMNLPARERGAMLG